MEHINKLELSQSANAMGDISLLILQTDLKPIDGFVQ